MNKRRRFLVTGLLVLGAAGAPTASAQDGAAPQTGAAVIARAWAAISTGDVRMAEQLAAEWLKKHPADHDALGVGVAALAASVQPVAALDLYEEWLGHTRREDVFLLQPIATATLVQIGMSEDAGLAAEALTRLAALEPELARLTLNRRPPSDSAFDRVQASLGDRPALSRLIDTLSAPSSREKLLALRNIAGLTGVPQTAIAPLLDDPAPPVRAAAIEAIGQFGNGAIGQLRPLLVDTDTYVRAIAAVTLGRLKDPEAVAMLGQMLQSPVNDTAAMAASVLRDQGADVSAAARRVLVDPNPLTRLSAVPLLAGTGDPAADAALQRALADANPVVRARAAEIVGDSTGPDLPRLRRLLRDGIAEVRMGAAVAVARMAGPH